MSDSTTPLNNDQKNGNVNKTEQNAKPSTQPENTAKTAANKPSDSNKKKSVSSPTGIAQSSEDAAMNDKTSNKNQPTDPIKDNQNAPKATDTPKTTDNVKTVESKVNNVKPEPTAKNPAAKNDVTPPPTNNNKNTADKKSGGMATTISVIALALVIGLGAGLYYHGHNQSKQQLETIQQLQSKLDKLEPMVANMQQSYTALSHNPQNEQIIAQQQQLQAQLEQQKEAMSQVLQASATQAEQFQALQNKVSSLSTTDTNLWLLAEADFLVKQAARKLNTEKDVTTAIALLSSADASIKEMNDPSLHDLRSALSGDITTLAAVPQVDIDGIMTKLQQLSGQIDKMVLISNQLDDTPTVEQPSTDVSDDINDWQDNLHKTWKGFISDFISITPIDTSVSDVGKPELTANQGAYLRENIRLQLLVASQAVPTYQDATYHQALDKVLSWVNQYYDMDNSVNQGFVRELEQLQKITINVDIPQTLNSQPVLSKLVETRLRSLLAQNATPTNSAE